MSDNEVGGVWMGIEVIPGSRRRSPPLRRVLQVVPADVVRTEEPPVRHVASEWALLVRRVFRRRDTCPLTVVDLLGAEKAKGKGRSAAGGGVRRPRTLR